MVSYINYHLGVLCISRASWCRRLQDLLSLSLRGCWCRDLWVCQVQMLPKREALLLQLRRCHHQLLRWWRLPFPPASLNRCQSAARHHGFWWRHKGLSSMSAPFRRCSVKNDGWWFGLNRTFCDYFLLEFSPHDYVMYGKKQKTKGKMKKNKRKSFGNCFVGGEE